MSKKNRKSVIESLQYTSETWIIQKKIPPEFVAKARLISVGTRFERMLAFIDRIAKAESTPIEMKLEFMKLARDICYTYAESAKLLLGRRPSPDPSEDPGNPTLYPNETLAGNPSFPPAFPAKNKPLATTTPPRNGEPPKPNE